MSTGSSSPPYLATQVDNCAFAAWYSKLKHVSIKSVVVPLPPEFIDLLLADSVMLPEGSVVSGIEDDEANENEVESVNIRLTEKQLHAMMTVRKQVEQVLQDYHGSVFPKTNWSAPRDAAWMLGTLKCTSFDDVFLLLQASNFVVHDLTQPYSGCITTENDKKAPCGSYVVLKKWCNFLDSMLFRCFVLGHCLVAVSQRNCNEFYEFLLHQQETLCDLLYEFYTKNFRNRDGQFVFPDPNYSFDVYIDKRQRVYLLDINVFGSVTDPLLFSWEELLELQPKTTAMMSQNIDNGHHAIDFRVVESKKGICANSLSGYRAPTDLVDHLASGAGFEAFIEQVQRDNTFHGDNSDDSDGEN